MVDKDQEPDSEPAWNSQFREPGDAADPRDGDPHQSTPSRGSMFAPKSFAGGRIQVYGCSPRFLLLSLLISLLLTILLNVLF